MQRELRDQRDIIRSIKAQSGFARKWAGGWQVGNPDLICSLPEFGLFLMEVKTLHIHGEGHVALHFKFDVSRKQRDELLLWDEAGALVVLGIVVHGPHYQQKRLFLMPRDAETLSEFRVVDEWDSASRYNITRCVREFRGIYGKR